VKLTLRFFLSSLLESRYRILEHLWTDDINNTVAVTGDVHSAW
jgi:phosphodiesterase/alkaline phosphatase D-like protein